MIYQYICHQCEVIFEKSYDKLPRYPGAKKKHRCGLLCPRTLGGFQIKVSGKVHKVDKTDVEKMYKVEIEDSKQHIKNFKPYAHYYTNPQHAVEEYGATKVTEKVARQKFETSKKAREVVDKHRRKK